MTKKFTRLLLGAALTLTAWTSAQATVLTTSINMDNGFVAYISTDDSVQGTQFGSGNNWPATINNSTTLVAGQDYFLHIYGYDQGGIAGFLGQFSLDTSDHVFANGSNFLTTNTVDWDGNNTGWGNAYLPSLVDLGGNGVSPWGFRGGVSSAARWIWAGDAHANNAAYFSTAITATASSVPAPAALLLLLPGLLGIAWTRHRSC